MKIAICTGTFSHFSGIDRVVALQARRLILEGHSVTIVCFEGDMECPGASIIRIGLPRNLTVQRLVRLLYFFRWKQIRNVAQQIKDSEIIYAHQYPMTLIASEAAQVFGQKFIYYNHGVPPARTFNTLIEKLYISLFAWLSNRSIRSAQQIISISQYLADVLKHETGLSSNVVHNEIDTKVFHPGVVGDTVRTKYKLGNAPIMLYTGRLSPHKGVHELISIYKKVRKKIPSVYLLVVGKQTFKKYYDDLLSQIDDHVIFCGYIPDEQLPHYYAACTVYATATRWEGFDLPVAEAQAMGKPVVAYDIGPHRELMTNSEDIIVFGDQNAFANRLLHYLSS